MGKELALPRKWTFRAHGEQVVLVKKAFESAAHVWMKALLWALFLPDYPGLSVEIDIGGRYKPDLVQLDNRGEPVFWAEAGRVGRRKMSALVQRFRSTHLVFAKWETKLAPLEQILKKEARPARRSAPVDLVRFPAGSDRRFIHPDGRIRISLSDVEHVRF